MDPAIYEEFRDQEAAHWWFRGRRAIFEHLLARRVVPGMAPGPLRGLDLGCGMGGHLNILATVAEAFGTDFMPEAARHCVSRGFPRIVVGRGECLPFPAATFDIVTAFDTIEHIPDDAATVRECLRILKPGGRMFISGPAYQCLYSHQDRVVQHQRRYTTGRARRLFTDAGFVVEQASYINFLLFPLILPAVLLIKLKQALFPPGDDDHHSNANVPFPPWAHRLLTGIFSWERHVLARMSVPAGHSFIVIARKPLVGA